MPALPRTICLLAPILVATGCHTRQRVQRIEMPGAAPSTAMTPDSPVERWPEFADRGLQALWELYPGRASALGVHRYDRQLARRSGKQLKAQVDNLTRAVQNLYAIPVDDLAADERIDHQLLVAQLRLAIHEIAVEGRPLTAPSDDLDELRLSVLALWLDGSRPLEQRLELLAARLLEVPVLLAATRENLHQPARCLCRAAAADAAALAAFLEQDLRRLAEHSDAGLRERLGLGIDEAVRALGRFGEGLEARCQDGPELVPVGAANVARRLSLAHGLRLDVEAALALARQQLAMAQARLAELPRTPPRVAPAAPDFTQRALLDTVAVQTQTLRSLSETRGLVATVPAVDGLRVLEPPALLRGRSDDLRLWPLPAFGAVEPVLLVDLVSPGDWSPAQRDAAHAALSRGDALLALARETYPGSLLRRQLARRQASAVRRAQDSTMLDQGWALHAMRLALDAGLVVGDATATRARWQAVRDAAARGVVDMQLQTGALDVEQAVASLEREGLAEGLAAPARRARLEREVLDLLRHPTRATAAILGLDAIERLRARAEAYKADRFELGRFNDALLGQGAIPPAYIAHVLFGDPLPTLDPFVPPGQQLGTAVDPPAAR